MFPAKKFVFATALVAVAMSLNVESAEASRRREQPQPPAREDLTGPEFERVKEAVRTKLLTMEFNNCKVEQTDYLRFMTADGKWLGAVLGGEGKTRIWRKQIGGQPVLEFEDHLDSYATPTSLTANPAQKIRLFIYTDRYDTAIQSIIIQHEEGRRDPIGSGTVSRPQPMTIYSVLSAISCIAKK